MNGIIFLSFIFIILIFIFILNIKAFLSRETGQIKKQLYELKKQIESLELTDKPKPVIEEKTKEIIRQVEQKEEKITEPEKEVQKKPETVIHKEVITQQLEKRQIEQKSKPVYRQTVKPEKKTDFEKFIGENLMNKIGILILVIAVGLGIKYAIGEGWISPVGRILIGLLTGTLLIALAHKLRKNYIAFSSVLIGGGIAVYYFSIAFGYQMYEIFSQTQAFLLMIGITGFTVALSLVYDRKELAVLAIIGGFATPIMVSSGAGNYKVLFTYIMILDIGMVVLAYYKKWNLVNIVAYVSTVILYSVWLTKTYHTDQEIPYLGALLFATGFYLIFFLMNIINNLKEKQKFVANEFLILISNSFFYYVTGLVLLNDFAPDFKGLFTIALAVLNAAFAYPLYKRKDIDRNLILLLIGLVLTFVSLTAPTQFEGNSITMFWAIESVLLLWLAQKSGLKLLKTFSVIILVIMFPSLTMDWGTYYFDYQETSMTIIFNKAFITGIIVIASLIVSLILLKKENQNETFIILTTVQYQRFLTFLLIITGYFAPLFEIIYQTDLHFGDTHLTGIVVAFFTYLYITGLLLWTVKTENNYFKIAFTWISIFALAVYTFLVHIGFRTVLLKYLDNQIEYTFAFLHFITVIIVLTMAYFSWKNMKTLYKETNNLSNIFLWVNIILSVYILSNELDYTVLYIAAPGLDTAKSLAISVHKIGWPILWGIIAFILMILGMKIRMKNLRIISISLFFFTLLKLFAIDVWDMSKGGRIAALISLGIILLVVSFLYQKLKKLIFEEEDEKFENRD